METKPAGDDIKPPPIDDLVAALKGLLRKGLPVTADRSPQVLVQLRGVRARSIDPTDLLSRVKALNTLLQGLLLALGDGEEAQALQILFAVRASDRGTTLTQCRSRARHVGDWQYDDTHFRKHIEPRLLRDLAWFLHEDSQNYTPRTKYAPLPTEVSGDTPALRVADLNEQEELVSRIWALVYELRAELIRKARFEAEGLDSAAVDEIERATLWIVARLLARIHEYLERFGDRIMQGDAEFRAEGLIRLAGWSHEFDSIQARRLRLAYGASGNNDRDSFLRELDVLNRSTPTP
jgi:hypothetical protein